MLKCAVSAATVGPLPSVALAKSIGKVSLSYGVTCVASLHQHVIHFTGCKRAVLSTTIITEIVEKKKSLKVCQIKRTVQIAVGR